MKIDTINKIFEGDIPSVIKNFIELHDNLDLNETQIFNNLFSKMDKYELIEKNTLYEGLIYDCLTMIPKEKMKKDFINDTILDNLEFLMKDIDTIEDGYYYKALITLIKKFNYIDYQEQIILNFLFYELNETNKKINEIEKVKFVIK